MLSKCLNPQCTETFRYLRSGSLYRVDYTDESRKNKLNGSDGQALQGKAEKVEHFWLCEKCSKVLKFEAGTDGQPHLVPRVVPRPVVVPRRGMTAKVS
jgi:hypothetical protein